MTRFVTVHVLSISFRHPEQSINVVECPEFRRLLLLLRPSLRDSDIPKQTKTRELILQAWREYFQVLKHDLHVSVPFIILVIGAHSAHSYFI